MLQRQEGRDLPHRHAVHQRKLVGMAAKHSRAGHERGSSRVLRIVPDLGQADACADCQRTLICSGNRKASSEAFFFGAVGRVRLMGKRAAGPH
ncbi:hypothetical protein VARIO8X_70058 [Burkholderiales bacterium 8X]|nr:hypothetical protein VARIO8X_70058 [Burkholderiales bacterium 8X]